MIKEIIIALIAGAIFGAGLAFSGMADPMRVRVFLDVFGHWDPTLMFVMAGAILPMSIAWSYRNRLKRPLVATKFALPEVANPIDGRLAAGALLFGVGWGVSGLCPGPALVGIALAPSSAMIFVVFMLLGMLINRFFMERRSA